MVKNIMYVIIHALETGIALHNKSSVFKGIVIEVLDKMNHKYTWFGVNEYWNNSFVRKGCILRYFHNFSHHTYMSSKLVVIW